MTLEPAHLALIDVVGDTLVSGGAAVWQDRVYFHHAPAESPKPYVIILLISSGETGRIHAEDSECILAVKVVAQELEQAGAGAALIVSLLRDKGTQDTSVNPLDAGAEWQVSYSRKLTDISYVELISNTEPRFHEGAQFKFRLERK